eukprot:1151693-Pelagomonas_calceolata.AAC.12
MIRQPVYLLSSCTKHLPLSIYKVKPHAGIAGNKCADALAKHQAIQGNYTLADKRKDYASQTKLRAVRKVL